MGGLPRRWGGGGRWDAYPEGGEVEEGGEAYPEGGEVEEVARRKNDLIGAHLGELGPAR